MLHLAMMIALQGAPAAHSVAASAAPTSAVQTARLFPASGTYVYRASSDGQAAGNARIVVARNGASISLSETSSGIVAGQPSSAQTAMTLAPNLAPLSYAGRYDAMGKATSSTVSFSGGSATATGMSGTSTLSLVADAKHFVILDGALVSGFFALPAQMKAWGDTPAIAVIAVYGVGVPIAVAPTARATPPAGVPATDVHLSFDGTVPFSEWYNPATLIVDQIDVPSQGIIVTRRPA
ncbi:MAG: hypothetical protein ACYDA5_01915 [Vulcanimicrobiaceae bacterium]